MAGDQLKEVNELAQVVLEAFCEHCGRLLAEDEGKVCIRCEHEIFLQWVQAMKELKEHEKALGQGLKRKTTPTPSLAR